MENAPIKKAVLTVITNDAAAEIFVIDGLFHRVGEAAGERAQFELPQGLYAVKVRAGAESKEQSVVLTSDQEINFAPIEFVSSAPLQGTAKTHEFHMAYAENYSKQVQLHLGSGSSLYIFARNWTSKIAPAEELKEAIHPAKGLTLRDRHDTVLVDFEKLSVISDYKFDMWAACNVELEPGNYCLCQEVENNDTMKQTITCCGGWQTQVFLLEKNTASSSADTETGISNASVFMVRLGQGFSAFRNSSLPDLRLTELIRKALISNRKIITDEMIGSMLDEKFDNPMLGIFAAHLLLLNKPDKTDLLRTVVMNMKRVLNTPHPDIEVLLLKLDSATNYVFDMPPMLRRSWNLMLDASVINPSVVPEDSLVADVAGRLWCEDLWLIWGEPYHDAEEGNNILVKQITKQINLNNKRTNLFNISGDSSNELESMSNPVEYDFGQLESLSSLSGTEELTQTDIGNMVKSLGLPRAKVETLLKRNNIKF